MAYSDLSDARRRAGGVEVSRGSAMGGAYSSIGSSLASGLNLGVERMREDEDQATAIQHDKDMVEEQRKAQEALETSRETRKQTLDQTRARAAANALRSGIGESSAAPTSPAAVAGAEAMAAPEVSMKSTSTAKGGPSVGSFAGYDELAGVGDTTDVLNVHKSMVFEDERRRSENRRVEGESAAARAIDALRSGDPQNPMGNVAAGDIVAGTREGYGPAMGLTAGAERQAEFQDPLDKEQTDYTRKREGAADFAGFMGRMQSFSLKNQQAQAALRRAQQPTQTLPKISDLTRVLSIVTGPKRDLIQMDTKRYYKALNKVQDPMMLPEEREAAQREIDQLVPRLNALIAQVDQSYAELAERAGIPIPGATPGFNPPQSGNPADAKALEDAGWLTPPVR